MPLQPTYPGVYIEEVPSGVRTITGVATSITAFIGRASRGPVNVPVTINNFGDYERQFGGVAADSMMSYAVRDFYQNGGGRAVIIRITPADATVALLELPVAGNPLLVLEALDAGNWGSKLKASINYKTKDADAPSPDPNLFNLTVSEAGGTTETFLNVSSDVNNPRYLPRVLEQTSALVHLKAGATLTKRPDETIKAGTGSPPTPVDIPIAAKANSASDGTVLNESAYRGSPSAKTGVFALENAEFNLLCIPPASRDGDTTPTIYQDALALCIEKRALLLVDPPLDWGTSAAKALADAETVLATLNLGANARNAALYFPRVKNSDSQRDGQTETFVPCGLVAGIMARTDASRGVWKSPAGLDASLNGIQGLQVNLTDAENGILNPLGINCLRQFPVTGRVVWGARTLRGADQLADTDNKYVAVRRTSLFIEESLYRGTQWVVFEPNDEPLWAQIRLNVGAFMHNLFRQGAFQGKTPKEAYLVKCDRETTTQTDINQGVVNVLVGFAPLKPAEFVFIKIQQLAGQIEF